MTRLKLEDLADEKPVRLTVEVSARLHREMVAYATASEWRRCQGCTDTRTADPADDRAVHLDRSELREIAAHGSAGIALFDQFEEMLERRVLIVIAPVERVFEACRPDMVINLPEVEVVPINPLRRFGRDRDVALG